MSSSVDQGQTLGIVGKSGCGKSTTERVISKLLEPTSGENRFNGRDIAGLKPREMKAYRSEIQMIFQDPFSSLNPRHTVGTIVGAPFRIQRVKPEHGIKVEVQSMMERVGLNPEHYNRYQKFREELTDVQENRCRTELPLLTEKAPGHGSTATSPRRALA